MSGSGIVGRDEELARIAAVVRATAGERGVMITGPPGIGKTALWTAACAQAAGTHDVLACSPAEAERDLHYSGLSDILNGIDLAALAALAEPQHRALRMVMLLAEAPSPPPDDRAVCYALLSVVRSLSALRPVLLAVDDVTWLDLPSASALSYVARRTARRSVRFLFSASDVSAPSAELLLGAFNGLPLPELGLGPLDTGSLYQIVRTRLHVELARPELLRLHDEADGNPLAAIELTRARPRIGDQADPPLRHPVRLTTLVRGRLDRLSSSARDVLCMAALLAHPTERVLTAACGDGVLADIDLLVRVGVARWHHDRLRLSPPHLGLVVTEDLSSSRLRALHARAAAAADNPVERVHHLALSVDGPCEDVAHIVESTAQTVADLGASAELLDLAGSLTPPDRTRDLARRLLAAAEAHLGSGNGHRARALLDRLVATKPATGDRIDALVMLARAHENDLDRAVALSEQAASEAEASADGRRAGAAHAMLSAIWLVSRLDVTRSLHHARRAVELLAGSGGCPPEVLTWLASLEDFAGPSTTARLDEAMESARTRRVKSVADHPVVWLGHRRMLEDRFDEARTHLLAALGMANDHGDASSRAGILLHLTEVECRSGHWSAAAAYAGECRELVDQKVAGLAGSARYAEALVSVRRGEIARARELAIEGERLARAGADEIFRILNLSVRAHAALSMGEAAHAAELLRTVPDQLVSSGWREPTVFPLWADAIEALLASGDVDRAARYQAIFAANAHAYDRPTGMATSARCAGLLRAACGDLPGAIDMLAVALRWHERSADRYELGRTYLALGATQRRAKLKRAARASLGTALGLFESLGSPRWSERVREEVARIGGRTAAADLTTSEERVAALAAQGATNREIAARLFVTPKTVEVHLSRIYRKVGVRSRAELAHRRAAKG